MSGPVNSGGASVERVRAALLAAGHADSIAAFPAGTRTAADAAAAIGCTVAQIAKSIVFRGGDGRAVVVIASGANRVDARKVAAALGVTVGRADADWVRAATGFAIGGVAPLGHAAQDGGAPLLVFDRDLLDLHPIWAAAGSPSHVFRSEAGELARITGAVVADIRQDG
ncbi:MAG: prolyl-tRNA editing protein [Rhodospirillales bacterium 70-18]|nr:YbaK/EbsC family protein [Rhodospirillales bacterium]OJY65800.1 MAG: prolyl-tRNA editing protein [Rhodospirillales bacterium 70-18]